MDIADGVDPETNAWISSTTLPTSEGRRQQETAKRVIREWKVRQQKAFYRIRGNIDDETCQGYDDIKTSSALLKRLGENSKKYMSKDAEFIEIQLFSPKLKDCGTVRFYYDEIRMFSNDLEACRQLKLTHQKRYRYLKRGLPKARGQ